jgi:pseudoazurin
MAAGVVPALAADHQVLMLNKDSQGRIMQFEPAFLRVEPGDTVTFIPQDKGHNSETVLDMLPDGAEMWKGRTNEAIEVTLTVEGLYAYKCMPHFGSGMIGLIQVGDSTANLADLLTKRLPPRAQARLAELFALTK